MALLKLDEQNMILNVVGGALEEYQPTDKVKALSAMVEGLKAKLTEFQKKEQDYIKKEVIPVLDQIRTQVRDLNEERYPELKDMREKAAKANGKDAEQTAAVQ